MPSSRLHAERGRRLAAPFTVQTVSSKTLTKYGRAMYSRRLQIGHVDEIW